MNNKQEWVCPFLGLEEDRDTASSFPSHWNRCYHGKNPLPVNLSFQRSHCLTPAYVDCEVYKGNAATPPYAHGEGHNNRDKSQRKTGVWFWIILVLIILAGLAIWLLYSRGLFSLPLQWIPPEMTMSSINQQAATIFPSTPEATQPTDTPVVITPTSTLTLQPPTPTLQPTVRNALALETPISSTPQLVIHRVRDGESLELISRTYATTVEAVLTVNYNLRLPLLSNMVVVVPLDSDDVSSLPAFQALQIQADIRANDLADQLGLDVASLGFYNDLNPETLLKAGEWVIVPHPLSKP